MGMPPACSEVLFNHICQDGLLPFPWLASCSAVSQQWRGDLANALPTLRALDFGDHKQRVTGADVLRALTRVSAANLRALDLQDLRRVDAANMEEILRVMGASFPDTEILQNNISLMVRIDYGYVFQFKMQETSGFLELMESFCVRFGYDMDSSMFRFGDVRLRENQTPQELDMEDGVEIDILRLMGGAPKETCYMDDHVVSSVPASGGTVPVNTEISVTLRRSKEPTGAYPQRQQITLAAFVNAAHRGEPVQDKNKYRGRVPPWTDIVLAPKFHVVVMDRRHVARVGGSLEYHCERNNGNYYGGDEHSWQRYTKQMPLAGLLAVDEATRSIHFTPAEPLRPAQTYGIVLQHYAFLGRGCHSDFVIPFTTEG